MKKLRLIIAEDHQELCQALAAFLSRKFEILRAVNDGRDLVDAAMLLLPDVIVSDISMPRLTGLQAMRELSARGYRIPFLFVTCHPALIEQDTLSWIDKMDAASELVPAVEAVAKGKHYISARARSGDTRFDMQEKKSCVD